MTNTSRVHWRKIHKERKRWKMLVWMATLGERPKEPFKKAQLTLTRFSAREPDYDGLVSSFKAILDGLVEAKIIADDRPSVVGQPTFRWEKTNPGSGRIRVEVVPL